MDQKILPCGQGRIDSVKINPSLLRMREWPVAMVTYFYPMVQMTLPDRRLLKTLKMIRRGKNANCSGVELSRHALRSSGDLQSLITKCLLDVHVVRRADNGNNKVDVRASFSSVNIRKKMWGTGTGESVPI